MAASPKSLNQPTCPLPPPTPSFRSLSISDDLIATGCGNGTVRIFSASDLKYRTTLPLPPSTSQFNSNSLNNNSGDSSSSCVRFLPGSTKISVIYSDSSLFVYDIADLNNIGKYRSFLHHSGPIWDIQPVPLKSTPASSLPHSPRKEAASPELPDGTFVTVSSDQTMRFWNVGVPGMARVTHSRWKNVFSRDLLHVSQYPLPSPSPKAVSDSSSSDPDTENFTSPNASNPSFRSLAMSPGRAELACGDKSGNVMIFDINNMTQKKMMQAHDAEVMSLAYSPTTSLLASASRDKLVHVFDTASDYKKLATLPNHTSTVTAVKFSNDGEKIITCGGDRALHVSDLDLKGKNLKAKKIKTISAKRGTIYDVNVDASNKFLILSGQDKSVSVYNMSSGRKTRSYKCDGVTGELYKLDIDPSGLFIATAAFDKWIRIFDFYSGNCIGKVAGHSELVTGVKFTLDGRRLISIGADGCIFVWRLAPELTAAMQERLTEMKRKEAQAVAEAEADTESNKVDEETKKGKQVVVGEIPDWAKTVKTVSDVASADSLSSPPPAPAPAASADDDESSPSPSGLPPPPPPEDDYDDDDFEFDDDNSVVVQVSKNGRSPDDPPDTSNGEESTVKKSQQPEPIAVLPGPLEMNENMDMSAINEDDADAPSLFYTSIEGGIMDNMFESKPIGKDAELVKKDDDLLMYGDDDVDDSCYVKVMDDIAKGFLEGRTTEDDSEVRESLSKNFLRKYSEDMGVEDPAKEVEETVGVSANDGEKTPDDASSVSSSISIEQLERSLQVPETSLKEERAILKNSERKKQTEKAVDQMREKLSAMGFLSEDEINPKTSNLDKEIATMNEALRPQTAPVVPTAVPTVTTQKEELPSLEKAPASDAPTSEGCTSSNSQEVPSSKEAASPTLTIDTSACGGTEGPNTDNTNKMFLSPATTVGSEDDVSLIGLSFANTKASKEVEKVVETLVMETESVVADNEEASMESEKSVPIQSDTSPSNAESTVNKENSAHAVNAPPAPPSLAKGQLQTHLETSAANLTNSVALRRPKEVYKKTLTELNAAMKNAFDAYQELLETSLNTTQEANTNVLEESVLTLEDSEPLELLNNFRDSFASLQGRMAVFQTNDVNLSTRMSSMPSILEDSTTSVPARPLMSQSVSSQEFKNMNSLPPTARPVTAPARRSEAELLDGVLEKYSDILLQKMMAKMGK